MRTRTFLLLTLALVIMLAIGCGNIEVEKEVQIGESVTIGGFTNKQLRSPEFRNCLEGMVKLLQEDVHTHTYSDRSQATNWKHNHNLSAMGFSGSEYRVNEAGGLFSGSSSGNTANKITGIPSRGMVGLTGCNAVFTN